MLKMMLVVVSLAVGCVAEESKSVLPITNQAELDAYLKSEPSDSPLRELSGDARQRFLSGLRFGEAGGLSSFRFSDLRLELEDAQARSVLRLFDMERAWDLVSPESARQSLRPEPPLGNKDYWCRSRATCAPETGSICTTNC